MNARRGVRWATAAWLAAALAAAALAGCAALFGPRTVEVTQTQLQQLMERQFPIERRYLELLDVRIAAPQLALRPAENRLATEVEVRVTDRIFKVEHRGSIALNYGLRFEPGDNSIRLTNVRVDRLDVDGAPALLRQQLDRAAVQWAEQSLNERPLYTLRPKDVEAVQGRGYRPTDIRVTPTGLVITLMPDVAR